MCYGEANSDYELPKLKVFWMSTSLSVHADDIGGFGDTKLLNIIELVDGWCHILDLEGYLI
jgi:hypothetical protein